MATTERAVRLDLTLDPEVVGELLRTSTWQEASAEMEAAVREAEELINRRIQSLMERAAEPAEPAG